MLANALLAPLHLGFRVELRLAHRAFLLFHRHFRFELALTNGTLVLHRRVAP
ncbi:hypothetical protein D3C83_172890 [compost metagenome]